MREKLEMTISVIALVAMAAIPWPLAAGQGAAAPSLEEQLQAQYKLTRIAVDANGPTIIEPGTVLTIQKGGILGVPPTGLACAAKYQDGTLHSPNGVCANMAKQTSRIFETGEKVYATKIEVKPKNDKVSVHIVACDSCNGTNPATFYKSQVDFQFAKGYMGAPDVSKIEDAIGEVFTIDTSNAGPEAQQPPPQEPPPPAGPPALTNEDIIKLVQAKLGNSIIIKKINSSPCAFDTSADGLVKLKGAGVSEAVIEAMVGKQ
jgi:hypothetical protein